MAQKCWAAEQCWVESIAVLHANFYIFSINPNFQIIKLKYKLIIYKGINREN